MTRDHRARGGREDDARAIVRAAGRGDAAACATIRRYLRRLGKALASVINLLDPDVVVLGGGLSNVDAIYGPELSAAIAEHAFSDAVTTPVRRARHGDSSGVRGAAWLWRQA
jgi:fructokinase